MQVDRIWLDSNLIDLGPIDLIRIQQLKFFLIDDRIKLFNSIKSASQDWRLATYHDYSEDVEFDKNTKYTL